MTESEFDLFISYARADNADGWITQFVEQLVGEHERFTGGRRLRVFFDKETIAERSTHVADRLEPV